MTDSTPTVAERITAYLAGGGLFNPEYANHDAVRDLLIDARSELAAAQEWKERVLDELIVAHIYTKEHDTNPKKAIHDAIVWNCQVALDPAVSSDARALIANELRAVAAAKEALSEERNVSAWLSSDVTRLSQQLQEAQEARERAEYLLGCESRYLAAARIARDDALERAQRAEALAESLKADAERLAYLRSIAYRSYVGERRGDYWFLTALCADGGGADFIAAIDAERGKE